MKSLRPLIVVCVLVGTIVAALAAPAPAPRVNTPSTVAVPASTPAASPAPARTFPSLARPPGLLPPLPPKPLGPGPVRHVRNATGATISVTQFSGCGTTVGQIYNLNCIIFWAAQSLPASSTHTDYYYAPNATTPSTATANYATQTGPNEQTTLNKTGTWIFGSYNITTSTWDAVVYIDVGGANVFETYSDSFLTTVSHQFVANNSTTVYISASSLTPTDKYVFTVESTSIGTQATVCTAYFPTNTSSPPSPSLCDPSRSPGQTAPGGVFTVAWSLSTALAAGTYSISLYDQTAGKRLAQRQVALTTNGATVAWSLKPLAAATPTVKFAYDNSQESSVSTIYASVSGATANGQYTETVSDPGGAVVFTQNQNADGSGNIAVQWGLSQAQSPANYVGSYYTIALYSKASSTVTTAASFQIVGYSAFTQFTNPLGTALDISSGSATTGIKITNNSESVYGTGNGDPLTQIQVVTASSFAGVSLNGMGYPASEVIQDSDGQNWTVNLTCAGGCGGGAGNKTFTFALTPNTAGQALKVGSSITIPTITFTTTGRCGVPGCSLTTSITPQDGPNASGTNGGATNTDYFTDGGGNTYAGTGSVTLVGYRTSFASFTANKDAHGYTPRFNQAFYASTQPGSVISGAQDEFDFTLTNGSTGGTGNVQNLELTFPTSFLVSSAAIDYAETSTPASATSWSVQTCPNGTPSNVLCIQKNGTNNGIAPGATEHILVDINAPSTSFSYTEFGAQAYNNLNFSFTAASAANTVFVGSSNPQTVDSMALASYSLDSTLITPLFTPQTVGANSTFATNLSLQNASLASSPFPDYVDLVVFDVPSANALSSISVSTAGWSYIGISSPGGGVARYWFGLCAGQFNTAAQPPNDGVANCGSATEQSSLAPSGTLNIAANITTGAAGTITATAYAHGANGGGWSAGKTFSITVSNVAAAAGFYKVGTYNSPALVATNTEPQVGADSDATNGNTYVYQIQNAGQNAITKATITIPHLDTTGASGADSSGQNWQITTGTPPAVTGTTYNCSVTTYTSPTASADGSIVIGGASCSIPFASTLYVQFNAKAPYKVNSTYAFPTVVNTSINASEAWFSDTDMKIVLSASLVLNLPTAYGSSPGQSSPVLTGCGLCSFGASLITLGNYGNSSTSTFGDLVRVSVYTNATSPVGWSLYVVADTNPARTPAAPTNEFLAFDDSAHSSSPNPGINFDTTAATVIPTSGNGLLLADVGSGTTARRIPFDVVTSYQLSIGTEAITGQTVNLTFTWISN